VSSDEAARKICGDCILYHTPKCSFGSDAAGVRKTDAACPDFYPAKKGKHEKKVLKDAGLLENGCFEAVYSNGKPAFLVLNSGVFTVLDKLELEQGPVYPKETKNFPYEPYGVYEGSVPNREDLFWQVRNEFETWIDVEPVWKDILAACTMLTYQQEKLQTVPYLFLYGDNESGKSTVLQVLNFLCYRPLYGVTIPSADLYGYLEDTDGAGCILEDEVQGINKDIDKVKIYKAGYKQGACVPRTLLTQNERVIKYYRTFCFKACASEQIPQMKGFNERFLFISMVEGYPAKEWADISKEDLARLRDLRNMLLKWRMLARGWELPEPELDLKGRMKELWKPLLQVTHGLTVHDGLAKFVQEQQDERLRGKQNTLEGHIIKTVVELINERGEPAPIPFKTIWDELRLDLDGKVDERKPNVMDTSEFFDVTKNKVGYRLREILSGKKAINKFKDQEGNWVSNQVYIFEPEKLRRVARKYGYEFSSKFQSFLASSHLSSKFSSFQGCTDEKTMLKDHAENVEKMQLTPVEDAKLANLLEKTETNNATSSVSHVDSATQKPPEKQPDGIPCPYCKAQGKLMLFATDVDLRAHVRTYHYSENDYSR